MGFPLGEVRQVDQTILFDRELNSRGVYGNCLQAAVASALGLELDAVPHFGAFCWWEPAARLDLVVVLRELRRLGGESGVQG